MMHELIKSFSLLIRILSITKKIINNKYNTHIKSII
jgi:hypothetical protein